MAGADGAEGIKHRLRSRSVGWLMQQFGLYARTHTLQTELPMRWACGAWRSTTIITMDLIWREPRASNQISSLKADVSQESWTRQGASDQRGQNSHGENDYCYFNRTCGLSDNCPMRGLLKVLGGWPLFQEAGHVRNCLQCYVQNAHPLCSISQFLSSVANSSSFRRLALPVKDSISTFICATEYQ